MMPAMLTPRMKELLDRIQRANRPAFHSLSPQQARVAYRMGAEILDLPRAPLARVEDLEWAARPARLYAPSHERLPVLLYLHGGGFTIGDLETHDSLCRQLGCAPASRCWRSTTGWPRAPLSLRGGRQLGGAACALSAGRDPGAGCHAHRRGRRQCRRHAGRGERAAGARRGPAAGAAGAHHARHHRARRHREHRLFAAATCSTPAAIAWFFDHYIDEAERKTTGASRRCTPTTTRAWRRPASCWPSADPLVDEGLAYADRLRAGRRAGAARALRA
jgi:acetyl esterase